MSYWVGFKISLESEHIFLEPSETYDQAREVYEHTKKTAQPGELITPPFVAETEEEARQRVKEYLEDDRREPGG
jgi:hypothetical protein